MSAALNASIVEALSPRPRQDVGAEIAGFLTAALWKSRRVIAVGSRITPNEIAAGKRHVARLAG